MNIGDMLNFLMELSNTEIEELARGICSPVNLYKVRSGERELNAVFFYLIIRRLYLSPERFQMMIDADEYVYFSWIYEVNRAVSEKNYGRLQELCSQRQEEALEQFRPVIDHDLAYIRGILKQETETDPESAYREFRKAVNYMIGAEGKLMPGKYGTYELNRYMNYLRLLMETGRITKEGAKSEFDRILRIVAQNERDPREESKLYPRIICFMLNTVGSLIPFEIQKELLLRALRCLQRTYECYDLPELLRLLCSACRNLQDSETERYTHWHEAICTAFQTAGCDTGFNWYDSHDGACQTYLIHEYLRRSRRNAREKAGKRLTQEKVSSGIMEPENYARLESGKHRPRKEHYEELTKRMGVRSDLYRGEIITDDPNDFTLVTEIRRAANDSDAERLAVCLKMLSESLDRRYIENVQFLEQKQVDLDELTGEITLEEGVQRLIGVLEYTTPYRPDENHVYSYLEEETLYKIVRDKRFCGILDETDVEILRCFLKSEEDSKGLLWPRTCYIMILLSGILQTQGENEEAERTAGECLRELLNVFDAGVLINCLDILAESIIVKKADQAEKLIKAAYWLCDLYQDKENKRILGEYYFRTFELKNN